MNKAEATIHGAVSIVNAIATQKGATLGIELKVTAIVKATPGKGISIQSENKSLSSRLINKTIQKIVSEKELAKNEISVNLNSEIPVGYGLKSSSAISTAVALACAKIFKPHLNDQQILRAGVNASIETKVSVTGAYDDACGCYFGGFNVTDNEKRRRIRYEKAPSNLVAVIFLPHNRKRGNIKNLKMLSSIFENAWELARKSRYWDAMIINGLATSAILNSDSRIITTLTQRGALGASVSGNGPAIAAVTKKENEKEIQKVFSEMEGTTITSRVNNKMAEVYEL